MKILWNFLKYKTNFGEIYGKQAAYFKGENQFKEQIFIMSEAGTR